MKYLIQKGEEKVSVKKLKTRRKKMRKLTRFERGVIEVLAQGQKMNGRQIANALEIDTKDVSRIVCNIRKKFAKGIENAVYIFLTKDGYTLEETPDNLKYEGYQRLRRGTSLILNGAHVYRRYRAIALNDFNNLRLTYIPSGVKLMETIRSIKEE